ncbi:hypothetical protein [Sphingomonas beigongshangi]|uniref:hypothetical protein n=1 Tax=Sphingomonas beigongshangi TaxID=2782540 RepID=UPI00193C6523|nr:hypothetical protein [Sphingomonas beigongshangi]
MARIARRGNVRAIRPGVAIPAQRNEDLEFVSVASVARSYAEKAYQLAQTEPNSKDHRFAEYMAGITEKLPRNNLRLLVTPITPRREWFDEALRKWRVAKAAHQLAQSRWNLAYCLDRQDEGERHKAARLECDQAEADLNRTIEDALRTPTVRKCDALTKQEMIGKREWAATYRPDWQAIVDEDLARYPAKAPKPRAKEGR